MQEQNGHAAPYTNFLLVHNRDKVASTSTVNSTTTHHYFFPSFTNTAVTKATGQKKDATIN